VNNGKYKEGMKMKRNLKQLVELMKIDEDKVLVCLGVCGCLCHKRQFIFWQGKRGFYEEAVDMAFYTPSNYIHGSCDHHEKSLGFIPFDKLITYSEIRSDIFREFVSKFPLLRLMIRNNDRTMILVNYFEEKNARLWIGGNSRKFYFETLSAIYQEIA
jgi:hypothetical protein